MRIRYLSDVQQPHCIAGRAGQERDVPEVHARQLVSEGYAEALAEWSPPAVLPLEGEVVEEATEVDA